MVRPTKRCERSRARRWTSSTRRSMRSTLTAVRKLAVHRRGLGAAARREDEGEGAVVADLVDHLERLLEVGLGLAREADDDVGGDRAVGNVLADLRHAVEVALAVVGAAHPLEDPARARLQRQVDVLAERRQLGVGADHVLAHVLRVRARVADAVDSRRPRRPAPAARRSVIRLSLRQVAAVAVDVLAEQGHLAHAVGGEALAPRRAAPPGRGSARARGSRGRCSRSRRSCSPARSAARPGTRAPAAPAGGRRSPRTRSSPGRVSESEVRNSARRWIWPGPKATSTNGKRSKTSSLTDCAQQPPTPTTRSGSSPLSRLASPRWAMKRLSADSRIEQVLKRIRSASSRARRPRRSRASRACPASARSRARSSGTRRW